MAPRSCPAIRCRRSKSLCASLSSTSARPTSASAALTFSLKVRSSSTANTCPFEILSPTSTFISCTFPGTSKLTLELSAASTTPENRRILPEAGSVSVMVLIARTVSMGGGGCSLQAIKAEIRTTKDSSPNRAGAPLKTKNEPTIISRRLTYMGFVFGFNIFMLIELLIYAPKRC